MNNKRKNFKARLRQALAAPIFEDEEKTHRARLLNTIIWTFFAITLSGGLAFLILKDFGPRLGMAAAILVGLGGVYALMWRRYIQPASLGLVLVLALTTTLTLYGLGGLRLPGVSFYVLITLIAGLLLEVWLGLVIFSLLILAVLGLYYAELAGFTTYAMANEPLPVVLMVTLITLAFTAVLIYLYTAQVKQVLERARRNERALQESNQTLQQEIAERQQAETALQKVNAELQQTQALLRALIDNVPAAILVRNTEGRYSLANQQAAAWSGRPIEQILGRFPHEVLPPEVRGAPQPLTPDAQPTQREFVWPSPDKTRICHQYRVPIFDGAGNFHGICLFTLDVTEQKQLAEALRANETYLRTIINNIPFDLWVCDAEGRYIIQNAISFDLAGDLIGKTVDDLDLPPEARLEHKQKHLQALSGQTVREEIKVMVKGQPRILDSVQVPIRNEAPAGEGGRILGFIGMEIDITERKQTELALRRRAEEMTALYETSLEINAELDLSILLPAIVRRAATLLGVEMGTLVLKKPDQATMEIVATHNRPLSDLGVTFKMNEGVTGHVAQTGEPLTISDYRHWPGRAAYFANEQIGRALGVPLKQGQQVIGVLNVLDPQPGEFEENDRRLLSLFAAYATITIQNARLLEAEQHHREVAETLVAARTRELEAAQEKLIRQEKLAFLGQLAGGVGHELRNPLGVITNAIYFLRMVLAEADETVQDYLELIASRVQEADKIVTDLLNLSRTKLAAKERVAVSALVAETLRRYPPPAQVTIKADITQERPVTMIDPQQIGQVLANLVSNAYQAMPNGGVLTISAQSEATWVKLSVADTGIGMVAETLEKIFEPLFTTKTKGIGLGLAVSKNLVEVNGGTIEVESQEGQGTTFTLSLPAVEGIS